MSSSDDLPLSAPPVDPFDAIEPAFGGAQVISILDRLPKAVAQRRQQTSSDLVDTVAERIGVMAGRTRELESYVQKFEEWSSVQIEAVEMVADHWKNVTAVAEMRIDELQRSLESSKRRAELAECDLQNVRFRLEVLHDRIAKVFGATSRLRATRESIGFD